MQLWSDDTFTLHFGEGFEDKTESTYRELAETVSEQSLLEIANRVGNSTHADTSDTEKASDALRLL